MSSEYMSYIDILKHKDFTHCEANHDCNMYEHCARDYAKLAIVGGSKKDPVLLDYNQYNNSETGKLNIRGCTFYLDYDRLKYRYPVGGE